MTNQTHPAGSGLFRAPAVILSPAPPWHLVLVKFMHSKRQCYAYPNAMHLFKLPLKNMIKNVPFVVIAQNLLHTNDISDKKGDAETRLSSSGEQHISVSG